MLSRPPLIQRKAYRTTSLAAPVGGWNARDALGDMPESDAVRLLNWFPLTSSVQLRPGCLTWSNGYPSQVNSVMAYNTGTASKLFAASGGGIYDATAGGAVGAAVVSGLSSDKFLHTNFATPGGQFLYAVNGVDRPLLYNGATWTPIDGGSTPAITGVTTTLLNNVYAAKQRIWFIEKNSLRAWYLPVSSVGGAASQFDLSSLCKRGGYLVCMASWTVSGGFGINDKTAFLTSEGELLIYSGSDPSNASTWTLDGIYWLGSPMGPKSFQKFGPDTLCLTKEGLTPLSQGTFFADVGKSKGSLTDKIQQAVSSATTSYASAWGWQIQPFPLQNALILNVPSAPQTQYVMNTITGAWCSFQGWSANCWEQFQDNVYFGTANAVMKAWVGQDDAGAAITADGKQAFNYFGAPGRQKHFSMMRPVISATATTTITAGVNVDFSDSPPTTTLSNAQNSGNVWNTAIWGVTPWTDINGAIQKDWQTVFGIGFCAAPRVMASVKGISLQWMSTDMSYQLGEVL